MDKVRVLLVASALLMAACGGAAAVTHAKANPATLAGSVQLSSGANAGSDLGSDDVNRVNPPVKKGTGNQPSAPTQPQTAAPAAAPAAQNTGTPTDRCSSGGSGGGTAGNRLAPMGGKHPPLPMCAVQ